MTRKNIALPEDIFGIISVIKSDMEADEQRPLSYPEVILKLANIFTQRKEPHTTGEADFFIREAFLELIRNQKQTIVVGGGGGYYMPPPAQPQEDKAEKSKGMTEEMRKKLEEMIKLTQENMKGAVGELDTICRSVSSEDPDVLITPSDVASISKPEHAEAETEDMEMYRERRKKETETRIEAQKKKTAEIEKKKKPPQTPPPSGLIPPP